MQKTYPCNGGEIVVSKLHDNVYMLRVNDRRIRFFEALWEIPEGITYNTYLVIGEEKTVLLDTVKAEFSDCFMEALSSLTSINDIDGIVVHHSEPDHSGALPALLSKRGDVVVYSHPIARRIIENTFNIRLSKHVSLKDGLRIDLGGDNTLEFISTPWLHWPDTYMSILSPSRILFSGDAFGAYSIPEELVDDNVDFKKYEWFMRKYFATVIGAYRGWVAKGVSKLMPRRKDFNTIAPLHGLVLRKHVDDALSLYEAWGLQRHAEKKALVVYASMYGTVEKAAKRVAEMLREKGFTVKIYGFNDKDRAPISDVIGDAIDSGIWVIGAATYEASVMPLMEYVTMLLCEKAAGGQRVLIISSYGWGGAAAKKLTEKLNAFKVDVRGIIENPGTIKDEEIEDAVTKLIS
ncbi:FprA family A-type flavoprotein [Pyrofollis japonicus]|nr:FprA family A-type flavoprotein [Pyrofollis japonicus]